MQGACVFAMSAAMYGAVTYEDGRVVESNFHDYRMVRSDNFPEVVHTHIVPHPFEVHATGVGEPVYAAAALGLVAGDDIDALEVHLTSVGAIPTIYFSLIPGSPSRAGLGGTAGDIFSVMPGGPPPIIAIGHPLMGLAAGDNVTGFALAPEPSRVMLLVLGAMGVMLRRRRSVHQ